MSQKINKTYHTDVNVNLAIENVTRIKIGIMINVDVSANIQKNMMYVKKIIYGILPHLFMKLLNI